MAEKKYKVDVDVSAAERSYAKMKKNLEEHHRQQMSNFASSSRAATEQQRWYEKEIKLLKERNKLAAAGAQGGMGYTYNAKGNLYDPTSGRMVSGQAATAMGMSRTGTPGAIADRGNLGLPARSLNPYASAKASLTSKISDYKDMAVSGYGDSKQAKEMLSEIKKQTKSLRDIDKSVKLPTGASSRGGGSIMNAAASLGSIAVVGGALRHMYSSGMDLTKAREGRAAITGGDLPTTTTSVRSLTSTERGEFLRKKGISKIPSSAGQAYGAGGMTYQGYTTDEKTGLSYKKEDLEDFKEAIGVTTKTTHGSVADVSTLNRIGVSLSDANRYAASLAKTRGYAYEGYDAGGGGYSGINANRNTNVGKWGASLDVENYMAFEKSRGVDQNTLINMSRYQRMDTNGMNTLRDAKQLFKTFKGEGLISQDDNSRNQELLEQLVQINETQAGYMETISTARNIEMMGLFDKIGGSFSGKRMAGTMQAVTSGLRNPDNDYKKAMMYSVLREAMPDARFDEIQEVLAGGQTDDGRKLHDKDLMKAVIQKISRYGGGVGMQKKLLQHGVFEGDIVKAGQFQRYLKSQGGDIEKAFNISAAKVGKTEENAEDIKRASELTNGISQLTAQVTNLSASLGAEGIGILSEALKGMTKIFGDGKEVKTLTIVGKQVNVNKQSIKKEGGRP